MENHSIQDKLVGLGGRIAQLRSDRNWTQERLANEFMKRTKTVISCKAVSKWEKSSSKGTPAVENIIALAEVFGVTLDWLLLGRKSDPLYTGNYDNDYRGNSFVRYVLRTKGKYPLICVGFRPSIADDTVSDKMTSFMFEYAKKHDFDGSIMINLYPKRYDLPSEVDSKLIIANKKHIGDILGKLSLDMTEITLLAAWGDSFDSRPYFADCLGEIKKIADAYGCKWKFVSCTPKGHPCNPSDLDEGVNTQSILNDFNIETYLQKMQKRVR